MYSRNPHAMYSFADYFHHRRNDWPKERIPDFTIHASNRLTPIAGEPLGGKRANGTLAKIDQGHQDDKRRSRSLNSSLEARSERIYKYNTGDQGYLI